MNLSIDEILIDELYHSLSLEDLQALVLRKKKEERLKKGQSVKKLTEEQRFRQEFRKKLLMKGVLYAPPP